MNNSKMVTPGFWFIAGVALSLSATSCGKKKSSSDPAATDTSTATVETSQGETIALTGKLGIASATSASMSLLGTAEPLALTAPTYTVSCNALSSASTDVIPATSALGADGSFSISMPAAKTALGCVVIDSNKVQVATFSFKDPAQKDFGGKPKVTERSSLKADVALGTLSADLATAEVSVDTSTISGQLATATLTNPFFFDGAWVIAKAATLPTGYTSPCTLAEQTAAHQNGGNSSACSGPSAGEKIWIKTLEGTDTTNSDKKYGIMVWSSEAAFKACGSRLGFSYAEAKTNAGIDLTASGVTEGSFAWTTGWSDGWKNTAKATAQYADSNCMPATFTNKSTGGTFEAYKCTDANSNYSINLGGGCFTTTDSQPVQIMDWSETSVTNQSFTQSTDTKSGLPKSVMTGTYQGKAVKCISIGQNYNADGTVYTGQNGIQGATLVNKGDLCSSIQTSTTAGAMAQLRCYANYYDQNGSKSSADSVCLRKLQMDWTATDAAKFVSTDGPQTANGQDVLALLNYVDDDTATFTNDDVEYEGVQSDSMWVSCKFRKSFTMTLRRTSDTVATGEFINTSKLIDTSKAPCVAQYGTSARTMKLFMEFNKQ